MVSLGKQLLLKFVDIVDAAYGDYCKLAEVAVYNYGLCIGVTYDTDAYIP